MIYWRSLDTIASARLLIKLWIPDITFILGTFYHLQIWITITLLNMVDCHLLLKID